MSNNRPIIIGNMQNQGFNNSSESVASANRSRKRSVKSPLTERRAGASMSSQTLFSPILSQRSYVSRII